MPFFFLLNRCCVCQICSEMPGHLNKVNSLSCSRNQFEMIWDLWPAALSCWKLPSQYGYTVVIKRWTWSAKILNDTTVVFKWCPIGTKRHKVWRENTLITPPAAAWTSDTRQDRSMLSIFAPNSECCSRNWDSWEQATFFQSSIVQFL